MSICQVPFLGACFIGVIMLILASVALIIHKDYTDASTKHNKLIDDYDKLQKENAELKASNAHNEINQIDNQN